MIYTSIVVYVETTGSSRSKVFVDIVSPAAMPSQMLYSEVTKPSLAQGKQKKCFRHGTETIDLHTDIEHLTVRSYNIAISKYTAHG